MPRLGLHQAIVSFSAPGILLDVEIRERLIQALAGDEPVAQRVSVTFRRRVKPPAALLQVVAYIPLSHPYRQGWEAALNGKTLAHAPKFRNADNLLKWKDGWVMAYSHWIDLEWERYLGRHRQDETKANADAV